LYDLAFVFVSQHASKYLEEANNYFL